MGYRCVEGDGLSTRYDGTPRLAVTAVDDGPVSVEVLFRASEARTGEPADFTRIVFEDVIEYRWVASNQTYFMMNREDFEFGLIEIIDSELIAAMLNEGMYASQPKGKRFGGVIDEANLRHYRIGFDDYGTLDVVCLNIQIEHPQKVHQHQGL